jgi:hypothetical protein
MGVVSVLREAHDLQTGTRIAPAPGYVLRITCYVLLLHLEIPYIDRRSAQRVDGCGFLAG